MRLRWESTEAERLIAWLALVLGSPAASGGDPVFELAGGAIEVGVGSGPDRLTLQAQRRGADAANGEDHGFALVAVGIATVDTERHAREAGWTVSPLPCDRVLGASAAGVVGVPLILLEPSTEGRIAASLARLGEGPAAIYVRAVHDTLETVRGAVVRRAGATSAIADGPFGPEVALAGRPAWGPHLLIVASDVSAAGTIRA